MLPDIDLAPKGVGGLLDDAIAMYRANWKTLMLASLIVVAPFALILSVAQVFAYRGLIELFGQAMNSASPEDVFGTMTPSQAATNVAYSAMPLFYLARWYIFAAVLVAGPAILYGRGLELRSLLKPGWRPVLTLVGVQVLIVVIIYASSIAAAITLVGLAALPFLIPFLAARWSVAAEACVAEEQSAGRALKRSWALTRRRFWRTVGFSISLGFVTYAVSIAIQSPTILHAIVSGVQTRGAIFEPVSVFWKVFEGLLAAASAAILAPFTALAWYRYYLDLRSRSEGMDLLVRAHEFAPKPGVVEVAET